MGQIRTLEELEEERWAGRHMPYFQFFHSSLKSIFAVPTNPTDDGWIRPKVTSAQDAGSQLSVYIMKTGLICS